MFNIIFIIALIIPSFAFAESLQELEQLSTSPLYFTVPISEYRITPSQTCKVGEECAVCLEITFSNFTYPSDTNKNRITVITDRPIRQTSKVDMDEFVAYTTSSEKSGLIFTFDISYADKVVPANFTVESVTYDKATNRLQTKSQMNIMDQSVITDINNNKKLIGDGAVLNVEG